MKSIRRNISCFLLLFLCMLLDGQLSTFFSDLLPSQLHISSHLLLIAFLYLSMEVSEQAFLIIAFMIGLLYNSYYLNLVGITILLFPIFSMAISSLNDILLYNYWTRFLSILILVFTFEMIFMGIGLLIFANQVTFDLFVVYSLLPSLIFNLLLFLIVQPLFNKIHLI